jgi:hypothetical protein
VHDLDDPALARLTREARYETLIGLAAGNLRAGRPVVLVAPFSTERADPSAWATTTRLLEAEPTLVWLHLPPDELVRRLTRRAEARDENKIRDPASFLTALDLAPPAVPNLPLDASRPTAILVQSVLDHLCHPAARGRPARARTKITRFVSAMGPASGATTVTASVIECHNTPDRGCYDTQ